LAPPRIAASIRKRPYFSTLVERRESVTIAAAEQRTKSKKILSSDQRDSFTLAEFLEFARGSELKTIKLAHQGRQPVTY
jgi:hypothetical protein